MEGYAIGDEVFGVAPGCFGAAVVAPAQLLVHKPPGISFVEAATTPTTYVTVYSAFGGLTALAPGTKARVHACMQFPTYPSCQNTNPDSQPDPSLQGRAAEIADVSLQMLKGQQAVCG